MRYSVKLGDRYHLGTTSTYLVFSFICLVFSLNILIHLQGKQRSNKTTAKTYNLRLCTNLSRGCWSPFDRSIAGWIDGWKGVIRFRLGYKFILFSNLFRRKLFARDAAAAH